MNTLKSLVATLAILACSLVGAAADLPFGEAAWKNHVATNSYGTLVSVFQQSKDYEVEFFPSQEGTKFSSYEDFLDYIQATLEKAEEFITLDLGYRADLPVQVYIVTGVMPANTIPGHYGVDDLIYATNMVPTSDGHWHFPDGFLGSITLEYNTWQVLPLTKKAVSAKVTLKKRSTGTVSEQDTAKDPTGSMVKVNSRGSVSVREDLVWANPDYDMVLTVRYADGKTDTWDENGKAIAKLSLIVVEGQVVFELTGPLNRKVAVQRLSSNGWDLVREVTFTNGTIRIPHSTGTNTSEMFRLVDL